MSIPTCVITGRVAGDRLACGDCDPCIDGAAKVPDAVKRLPKFFLAPMLPESLRSLLVNSDHEAVPDLLAF